jgi:hypothetical protein
MYCKNCYGKLEASMEPRVCPWCDRPFNPADAGSYLLRPFPGKWRIAGYVLLTTIISIAVAYVVACFQLAAASGH